MSLDSYTKLLLHNDSFPFIDATGKIITNVDTTLDTVNKKFGLGSAVFNGSSSYLLLADSDDFYFGTGDFTIDFWVRFNSLTNSQFFAGQVETNISVNHGSWTLSKLPAADGNKLVLHFRENGSPFAVAVGYYTMTNEWVDCAINTQYHLCFERIGTSAKIFINGVSQLLTASTAFGTNDVTNLVYNFYIGKRLDTSVSLNGNIEEFRITKGIARWTNDFIPPASAYGSIISPFPSHLRIS